jgi:cobalt-zinc-cadmium efflux system protein
MATIRIGSECKVCFTPVMSACDHDHPRGGRDSASDSRVTRSLAIALAITAVLLIGEAAGGWLANSLALLADAGHVLTDAGALTLSLFVTWLARQRARTRTTYGYLRWEILAALFNAATLLLISVWIVFEASMRLRSPEPVAGALMLWVSIGGLAANSAAMIVLHGTHSHNLNVRAAYLHIAGDLLASLGTVAAAIIVELTGWAAADPLASLLTTLLIVVGAWRLLRESVDVLLEAAPKHISIAEVRACLDDIEGVEAVHDLHVWTVTSGVVALSAHAIVRQPEYHQGVLEKAIDSLKTMGIHHVTLQLERTEMAEREDHLHP